MTVARGPSHCAAGLYTQKRVICAAALPLAVAGQIDTDSAIWLR
jgi:hypothetical protein